MRKAIIISVLFHAALLTWALGYFTSSNDDNKPLKTASVPVDIMTPSQFTKIKAGKKDAAKKKTVAPVVKKKAIKKKVVKKKPAKKKPVVKKARPKSKPKKIVKAKPKPKKVVKAKPKPKKIVKAKPKPKKRLKAKPRPRPRPVKTQPRKRQSEFDAENIAALLNKLPQKKTTPRGAALAPAPRQQRQARVEPPSYGRRYGTDATMSANEIDAFRAQISRCWSPPTGGLGSRNLNVKLRIRFKQDGTLERPPELQNYSGSPFFRPAADAAKRAVWQCQPYRMPKDKFATWQDMILNFDPRAMFGG